MPENIEGTQKLTSEEAFLYNMRAMAQIVREMRLIPPEEEKKQIERAQDTHPLLKVEFPEAGGVLTYMEGIEEPFRGFPYWEFVDRLDILKKIGKAICSGIYHQIIKGNKLKLITLLPAFWMLKSSIRVGIYVFYRQVERFRIKPIRHCQAIREFYRIFDLNKKNEKLETKELKLMLRDVLCLFLEFDNAYRFRIQDWISEFNKENFKKNPIKELKRILNIAIQREKSQEIKDNWILLKEVFLRYLRFDKELKQILVDAFSNLNIEEVKLTKEDICYCKPRKDYFFGFMEKCQQNII